MSIINGFFVVYFKFLTYSQNRSVHLYSLRLDTGGALKISDMGKNMTFKKDTPKTNDSSKTDHNPSKETTNLIKPTSIDTTVNGKEEIQQAEKASKHLSGSKSPLEIAHNSALIPSLACNEATSISAPKITPLKSLTKSFRMYHDENLQSFFRRLTFTPDGSLLITPAGQYQNSILQIATEDENKKIESETHEAAYVYARNKLNG